MKYSLRLVSSSFNDAPLLLISFANFGHEEEKEKSSYIKSKREGGEERGEIYSHINSNVDSTRGCAAYSERLDNTNRRDPIWNILNFDIISILSGNIYTRRRNILYARQIRILFCFFSLFLLLN